jgi:hypothetical protein
MIENLSELFCRQPPLLQLEPESELAYWKCRVANLEIVVCELLVKNERLRRELQMSVYPRSGQASAPMDSQKG